MLSKKSISLPGNKSGSNGGGPGVINALLFDLSLVVSGASGVVVEFVMFSGLVFISTVEFMF